MMQFENVDNIALADPFKRLAALNEYMGLWVDSWPEKPARSFRRYLGTRYPEIIPGTHAYYRAVATNCYYCNDKLVAPLPFNENQTNPKLATIDHWHPKSKGDTQRVVVCCSECNNKKADTDPEELRRHVIRAIFRGRQMWGFDLRKLVFLRTRIEDITNHILYNTGPKVFYIQVVKKRKTQCKPKR